MNKKPLISAVITAKNEEQKIAECLQSVKWADEIIVVDDESTDKTRKIAQKFTNKIFQHKSSGYVEPVRNFAISKATGDWILLVDADEIIPESLEKKLREISLIERHASYISIPRKNVIFGKWIKNSGWWPDYQIRFFKKGSLVWPSEIHKQPELSGDTFTLEAREEYSLHHNHYRTISEYLQRMNRYTDVEAKEFIKSKKDFMWTDLITKPFNEFLSRFFARGGYRDGLHGLVLSGLQAISMFVVSLKIWENRGFVEVDAKNLFKETEKEARKIHKDLLFWFAHEKINEIKNPVKKAAYKLLKRLVK